MKFGMILIAIAVMALLIAFAFKALNVQTLPEDKIQGIVGNSNQVYLRIAKLCNLCTTEKYYNQECFLLKTNLTEGNITKISDVVFDNFKMLKEGTYNLKIYNNETKCTIKIFE